MNKDLTQLLTMSTASPKKRCGSCRGCLAKNCGRCKYCKDKAIYGGENKMKKACIKRKCEHLTVSCKTENSPAVAAKDRVKSAEPKFNSLTTRDRAKSVRMNPKFTVNHEEQTGEGSTKSGSAKNRSVGTNTDSRAGAATDMRAGATTDSRAGEKVATKDVAKTADKSQKERTDVKNKVKEKTPVVVKCSKKAVEKTPALVVNSSKKEVEVDPVTPSGKETKLPKIAVESMTQLELKAFIPEMLNLTTGRADIWHSRRSAKPAWWPESVTWATSIKDWQLKNYWLHSLQTVVRSCYKHMGQEEKLMKPVIPVNSLQLNTPEKQSPVTEDSGQISPVKTATFPRGLLFPFCAEIYICYFCEREFLNKKKMRDHQKECSERPPQLQQYQPITIVTEESIHKDPPTMSPKRNILHLYSPLSLKHFCSYMDLIPKQTAAKLRANRASMEIDCNLEEIEPTSPVTPITPRTPRSLISQLSRDDSGAQAKKRLSYSLSIDKEQEHKDIEPDSDFSDAEDDQSGVSNKENKEANLLSIPISSLLGQRIKNYVHVESPMSVVDNMELFCRTPVKNSFLEKLRKKASAYPIVYKPRRVASLHKQNHTYKFTRGESQDFMCRVNTGLNPASLRKVRLTKPLSIVVEKMTRKQLLKWIPSYILDRQLCGVYKPLKTLKSTSNISSHCEFPSGPTLLAPNIDKLLGLKRRSSMTPKSPVNTPLSLGNFISEEMEAEVSKQKLTLYRCLLYEMSVLKPAVVIEDLRNENKASKSSLKKKKLSGLIDKLDEPETSSQYVVKASNQNVRIGAAPCKKEPEKPVANKKSNYRTLVSLLVPKDQNEIPQFKACDDKRSQMQGPVEVRTLRSPHSDSPLVVVSPIVDVQRSSTTTQSPGDDSLSIVSLSSDGESTNPSCCVACKNKCLRSPCPCSVDSVLSNASIQIDGAKTKAKDTVFEPINIMVDDGLFKPRGISSRNEDMYGIPSPVSTRSESPLPPTITKDLPSPKISINLPDQVHDLSPAIPDTKITDTPISVESAHKGPTDGAVMPNRLHTLRSMARSKSLTPSSSPLKFEIVASSSLPNSPEKAALEARKYFEPINAPSAKRKIFMGSVEKMRTRSVGLVTSDRNENVYSRNSGNSTEPSQKGTKQLGELGKMVCIRKSVSDCDSPLRRSKRKSAMRSSVDIDTRPPPLKLRKWNSEFLVNS